jgi:hypothetical protein
MSNPVYAADRPPIAKPTGDATMSRKLRNRCSPLAVLALWALAGAVAAEDHGRATRTPLLPLYQQECAACHIAYPPGLLPAASWQRLLADLPHHFGADASLDAAAAGELSAWLTANAGNGRKGKRGGEAPPADRITRSAWFVHEHDEVSKDVWNRPSIKSAANCAACHGQAEKGDFNEHNVRIPR